MPALPAPQPSGVRLFLEGVSFEVLDFSAGGVTVPRTVLDLQPKLRRGVPCPATLQVFGEMYGVILRLAATGPEHVEFAFVSLAPQARRALEHYAPQARTEDAGNPLRLAFAKLVEAAVPARRRLVLPESEAVYAATVERRRARLLATPIAAPRATPVAVPAVTLTLSGRELLLYAAALLVVLTLFIVWATP